MSKIVLPKLGEFPFQAVQPGKVNGYVAWIRDNSSYLTAGGIADQLASAGSYAIGTLSALAVLCSTCGLF